MKRRRKHVTLNLDGHETVVKTHATTVQQLLEDLDITLKPQDYVAPKKDTPISNDMNIVWKPAKQVQIMQKDIRRKPFGPLHKQWRDF